MRMERSIKHLLDRIMSNSQESCTIPGYTYYAFISYTEKDEKWAKWLQWKIEHYKFPTKVRSEHKELPARSRPVFWYKNDLSGVHLQDSINNELEQSYYLIVVCSPESANNAWVNYEVNYFKEVLRRGDRIISFVVDGDIKASDQGQACLPRPIRNLSQIDELRSVDVRKYGKNKALVNIIASLFNIRFDILWNRFKREQQIRIATCCAFFCFIMVALFGCWDYFLHTKYDYYLDYADCNGMPTGIIQISKTEANNHFRTYRFEKRSGLLRRVVYIDSKGNPQNHLNTEYVERPCILELSYNKEVLSLVECKDAVNRTLYIMQLSKDALAADLKDENENLGANFIFSSTAADQGKIAFQNSQFLDQLLKSPSKIARYIYERDEEGYIMRKMYAKHNGEDIIGIDANGISGFEYKRDSLHRIIEIRFLDNNYRYKCNNLGIAGKRYEYDKYGNLRLTEYVDKEGKLKYNELHWAKCINTYDNVGNCIEECVFGPDGEPCVSAIGYHRMTITTNENCQTCCYYDIHNNPAYSLPIGNTPGGFSIMTTVRNNKGQIVESLLYDANGNLCYNQNHVAIYKYEYDENGFVTDIRNYGIDKKPCLNSYGYFHEKYSYNTEGLVTEISVYNPEGKPTQNIFGGHRITTKYDNNRIVEAHAYDMDNMSINFHMFAGAAWIKVGYQGSSKLGSEITFYGTDNQPMETTLGARVCCERDSEGQISAYRYYDDNNELYSNWEHCAIMTLEYNDMGMVTNRKYYDEYNNPTLQSGVFQVSISYTPTGQPEMICYYDTLQCVHLGPEGWAMQKFTYVNGVQSSNSYYGEDGTPIEIMGVHKYEYEIDDCGYIISQSAFNSEMKPALNSQIAAHKVVNIYNDNRFTVGRDYYDAVNRDPFVRIRTILSPRGMILEQTAYDSNMELMESPLNFGVATLEYKYDSQDRLTYMCALDRYGKKMNTVYGLAEAFYIFEEGINEVVFLDSDMNIVNNETLSKPYAYMISYFSETGHRLYVKTIKLSYDNSIETFRETYRYDLKSQNIIEAIRCDDSEVHVYNALSQERFRFYSFEEEFDEYVHKVDSIQNDIEYKYGKPRLNKYIMKHK